MFEGGVCLHVGAEVRAVSKGFATLGAAKGLLAGVGPHVALEEPRAAEGFPTAFALVLEVVCEEMHGHGRHGHIYLATGWALLG